ncbi:glycoside/pentoside/hexuronide:cation symporter, GPH family [Tranquillimonas rosea]|uniref:Glycoside/pentoside/hexuronide:cation symporter, GPH family n=1 Tax=Tranquillimonas rosea TaxID=641238 RepID=A0A1H9W7J9_9RHOB|nr:MFS transporter [Tranquillimonas rosea]SES29815.1 glycoside/pentoside/hexuronide:cation symporter, GPH family [Tranquillimonas rosea]
MTRAAGLPGYAVFGGLLASAGLPIYIHAPKFYVDAYGVSLSALGAVLFVLRLIDVVQDPALGWLAQRVQRFRALAVAIGAAVMVVSMLGLFAVPPPLPPAAWFALTLTGLFSGFSFLTINFYAQGVQKAAEMGSGGHTRLAAWRETGALLGVCAAAVAPTLLAGAPGGAFLWFALAFVVVAVVSVLAMRGEWRGDAVPEAGAGGFAVVLRDSTARRLLLIALVNATPVAVTSTLFLFFVESRLAAPGWEGPLLVLFFLSAAASAPAWGALARRFGRKSVLLAGMVLAVVSFGFAARLGAGDVVPFAVICVASGATLGADMTLLPAIFAARMARVSPDAAQAFGLWSFVSKVTLAIAAVALLPILETAGFESGTDNPDSALRVLTWLYALVPCGLKCVAIALLIATDIESEET